MGYRAPSAQEVYRYALRVDETDRALTDRFHWSVILVGDYSPATRDFLLRHCLDLCARTSDRIRFIFFSDLPDEDFSRFARELMDGFHPRRSGFVSLVLEKLAQHRRYNFEEWNWRELRPEALEPLGDADAIEAELSFACQMNTAMPGSGESLRFAQRLGIGRHVPCLVMFSDVGELQVHILPFSHHDPDWVYQRLRGWIDSYYEANREALARWDDVEKRVKDLVRRAKLSLSEVQQWPAQRRKDWQALARLSRLSYELADRPSDARETVRACLAQDGIPWEVRTALRDLGDRLDRCDREIGLGRHLTQIAQQLQSEVDPERLVKALRAVSAHPPSSVPPSLATRIRHASRTRTVTNTPPEDEIVDWWRTSVNPVCSKRSFQRHRAALTPFLAAARRQPESISEQKARDHRAYAAAIRDIRVTDLAARRFAECANQVLHALAEHYGADPASMRWNDATASVQTWLEAALQSLAARAPEWLLASGRIATLGDCLPPVGISGNPRELRDFVRTREDLTAAAEDMATHREASRRSAVFDSRDRVVEELTRAADDLALARDDCLTACASTVATVRMTAAALEQKVRAWDPGEAPIRVPNSAEAAELLQALDEYDLAVRSIVLPYRHDDQVLRVSTRHSLHKAAGLDETDATEQRASSDDAVSSLRRSIADAADDAARTRSLWPQARREAIAASPATGLAAALSGCLAPKRLDDVLAPVPGSTARLKLRYLVSNGLAPELLRTLTAAEGGEVLDRLQAGRPPESWPRSEAAASAVESILILLGLGADDGLPPGRLSEISQRLRAKTAANEFDVFLAHHSADKEDVRRICTALRYRGINAWLDIEQIPPGRWFQSIIESAIRRVRSCAVVLGPGGTGEWQLAEIRAFVSRCISERVPLVPVLLPGLAQVPDELVLLRQLQVVRMTTDAVEPDAIDRLVWGITGSKEYA